MYLIILLFYRWGNKIRKKLSDLPQLIAPSEDSGVKSRGLTSSMLSFASWSPGHTISSCLSNLHLLCIFSTTILVQVVVISSGIFQLLICLQFHSCSDSSPLLLPDWLTFLLSLPPSLHFFLYFEWLRKKRLITSLSHLNFQRLYLSFSIASKLLSPLWSGP